MAVRHGYGKIAGADALVFAYDTGDTRNSYKGRPTTNYGPASFGDWGTESSAERIATGNTYNGQPTYNCRTVVGESYRGVEKTISGLRTAAGSSGTVTMSCMVRNNNSSAYNMYAYIGHDFGSTRTIAANSDWQKVQWTVNQSSMNNDYVEFRPYTNNASVYLEMTMPMVEVNVTYASQFVNGTRSATQGLLDLTVNKTIDLSSTGFDSNAQPEFDGTNDHMDVGTGIISGTGDFTVEAVIQSGYQEVNGTILANYPAGNFQTFFSGRYIGLYLANSSAYLGSSPFTTVLPEFTTDPIHFLALREGTETRVYLNGVLKKTGSSSSTIGTTSTPFRVGANTNGTEDFLGQIFVVKAYSRALTADEVRNNYNQYRTRFNI